MRAIRLLSFLWLILAIVFMNRYSQGQERIKGFYLKNAKKELALENKLKQIPSSIEMEKNLRLLTEEPHIAGTAQDYETAKFVRNRLIQYGIPAELDEYEVYLSYPVQISLKMLEPKEIEFDMIEKGWSWDKDSYAGKAIIPYHAYSPSGHVVSHIVYVNYGSPEDYKLLEKTGINVKGKIVIVRNGQFHRGLKVWLAEKNGASGIIIYSDPVDSGYVLGDVYPRGPMRPPSAVHRGNIKYGFFHLGDPLTPGWASKKEARRLNPNEVITLPKIPCIPLSYGNAKMLLRNLSGPEVPQEWQGGLPFRYHIGPGPTKVELEVKMEFKNKKIWNVVGTIEGTTRKNEWVIMGNHRDSWTFGASDPNSGTAVLLETARAFGHLLKEGYSPSRTIIFCSWDAEEFGIIGSTEWVEHNRDVLWEKCAVYLNVDIGVSGKNFTARATPSLKKFTRDVTKNVRDPLTGLAVYEIWRKYQKIDEINRIHKERIDTQIGNLAEGTDYAAFVHYAGISCLGWGLSGKSGIIHTLYDNFYCMSTFLDPGFIYHPVMAKLAVVAMLRLANSDILPFNYYDYAEEVEKYLEDLSKQAEKKIDLSNVKLKATEWKQSCRELSEKIVRELEKKTLSSIKINLLNRKLMEIERNFVLKEGLPKRDWYKHSIIGPGLHFGNYSSITLPGVRDAILEGNLNLAKSQLQKLSVVFDIVNKTTREAIHIFD